MRPAQLLVAFGAMLTVVLGGSSGVVPEASAAPPEQSTYLSDVQIDMTTVKKYADESDNFHLTWHGDDYLYGAYGDGWGFVRTDITKRAIGVSRISGTPTSLKGTEPWEGDPQGQTCCWLPWNGKSWGMISTGKLLHMWYTIGRPRALGFTEARIATSADNGKSWKKADWSFTPADRFLMPSFLQIGKGYSSPDLPGEVMNYVYSYHTRYVNHPDRVQAPGRVELVRVPRDQVREKGAYQFFAGTNGAGDPIWTTDLNQREPVLEKPYILDAPPAVSWNPHLQRFIMAMGHVTVDSDANIGIGFYEARRPWGPWFKIKEQANFAQGTIFFSQFPTRWMNADLTAWMGFTGPDKEGGQEWDALNMVKVRFVLAGRSGSPVYLGCYRDQSVRDINGLRTDSTSAMTVDRCASTCRSADFAYFGVQAGYACFCGRDYGSYGIASNCTTACRGDASQTCGGSFANSVYRLP